MAINRLVAHKVWISDLINNPYIRTSGEFESNYIEIKDKQVSRVNLVCTIVNKFESEDKNYVSLVLDDNTEQIRVKTWGEDTKLIREFNLGDIILIIGKIKIYNDEIYLLPEVVKKVEENWEFIRKQELLKIYGKPVQHNFVKEQTYEEPVVEEITFSSSNIRKEVLDAIEKYEEKLGITLEELKTELHKGIKEIYDVIEELIKEGQIYNVGNKYRLLL